MSKIFSGDFLKILVIGIGFLLVSVLLVILDNNKIIPHDAVKMSVIIMMVVMYSWFVFYSKFANFLFSSSGLIVFFIGIPASFLLGWFASFFNKPFFSVIGITENSITSLFFSLGNIVFIASIIFIFFGIFILPRLPVKIKLPKNEFSIGESCNFVVNFQAKNSKIIFKDLGLNFYVCEWVGSYHLKNRYKKIIYEKQFTIPENIELTQNQNVQYDFSFAVPTKNEFKIHLGHQYFGQIEFSGHREGWIGDITKSAYINILTSNS